MERVILTNPLSKPKSYVLHNEKHRWTEQEAYQLLLEVSKALKQRAGGYEKPTARQFYTNIASKNKQLSHISWSSMRGKMRYFMDTFKNKKIGKESPKNEILQFIYSQKEMAEASYAESNMEFCSDVADDAYVGAYDLKDDNYNETGTDTAMDESTEGEKNDKSKCLRPHWWTEEETTTFINFILKAVGDEPKIFEKPTARIFYETHCKQGILKDKPWLLMRNKMRYFRVLFYKAEKWLEDVGSELFKTDSEHVKTRLHSICPFYDELRPIFEAREPMDPIKVSWHSTAVKMSAQNKPQSNNNTMHTSFKIENGADDGDSFMISEDDAAFRAEEAQMVAQEEDEFEAENDNDDANVLTPEVLLGKGNFQKAALELQREKFEFEKHRFEIEREQWKKQHEVQQKLLDMEREKLEFEKQKLRRQENLKRYEIDQNIALKKLELEKDERLQKIELQYKHQVYQTDEALETEQLEEELV